MESVLSNGTVLDERIYNRNLRLVASRRMSQGQLADSLGLPRSTFRRSPFNAIVIMRKALHASRRTIEIYYTHAYTAWEKGSVENTNRIIRHWYKKGTDFRGVSAAKVRSLQNFINSIPRLASLGGRTANESFSLAA